MAEPRWLTDEEAQAWRRFTTMRFQLDARLDRQLGNTISIQDYGVLASLSEEPNKSMRISELGERLGWETSRGSLAVVTDAGQAAIEAAAPDHVASVRHLFIDLLTPEELRMISAVSQKVLGRLHDPADPTGS